MKYIHSTIICVFSAILFACDSNSCDDGPDVSGIPMEVEIERLDQEMFSLRSEEEIAAFLDKYPQVSSQFLNAGQYPDDSLLINAIQNIITDPYIDTLYRETQQTFGSLEDVEAQFETAFRHIKYYFPEFEPPKIYAAFTALGTIGSDLLISEDAIVISIEYYLGKDARFRPDVYDYMIGRYTPEHMVPSIIMFMSDRWNQVEGNTLLSEMIYYGKSYYFTEKMLPCLTDTIVAGYSAEELSIAEDNVQLVWSHFVEKELLYETSHIIKPKYVGERPTTLEINPKIPGRIGRWLGWQIVKDYVEETDNSLPELMRQEDAQQIFMQAKYRP
ncbi:MAG: gliding motility lipoprotein GldB [Cyclobacteriaceae bacterium]